MTSPSSVIDAMAKAINSNGWRDPAKTPETERDMIPIWRQKAIGKAERALAAAAEAGWVLVPAQASQAEPEPDRQAAYRANRMAWTVPQLREDKAEGEEITARLLGAEGGA
ncbi:MAG: hypothetical protein JWM33_394 [Caulobacteraceae bacterium]|nr:hypothetical protein [Caulobacteraceae bacterium]